MPGSFDWSSFRAQLSDLSIDGLSVRESEPLAAHTTLKIGGPARLLVRCAGREAVAATVRSAAQAGIPWLVLGLGANVLVPDAGLDAAVLMLVDELAAVSVDGTRLRAGGGAQLARAVRTALDAGLAGIECLGGIPSTVGGALAMNAGAYGGDFSQVLERALVATADGTGWLTPAELGLSYRHSSLTHGQVVVRAELRLRPRPPAEIKAEVAALNAQRKAAQPTNRRTFGSVFKNPEHELSAGRMLEACGLKGFRVGGAQISPKHANFIENAGGARSADAVALMAEARRRAHEDYGVELRHEVEFLGELALPPLGA